MATPFLRNDLIACAGVTALVCVLAFLPWPHAASPNQPHPAANPAHASQSAASAPSATPVTPQKPSAYGEAFTPAPPPSRVPPNSTVSPPGSAGKSASQPYPSVAPEVMAANLISAPPPSARIAHIRGQVTVQAVISSSGAVSTARALRGPHLLRGAAVDEVRRRRYRPYRMDGQPANVSTVVTVDVGTHS